MRDRDLKAEIARRKAHPAYLLFTDEEIRREIESEKSAIKLVLRPLSSGGRDPEQFLKEIFEWVGAVLRRPKIWKSRQWSISQDGKFIYLGFFENPGYYLRPIPDCLPRIPSKYFDRNPGIKKWPIVRKMTRKRDLDVLAELLKDKLFLSILRRGYGEWWLIVVDGQ